ncbi:MAG: hypothetical protein EOO89_22625 [Pedobacter sp.]|nr:MAG: hypothetical protein EOO89_22625 [Pedobacter sp.]
MKIPPVYKDYLDAIVRYYKQEKTTPDFSNRLLNPTSANLRDECLTVFLEGPAARDMKALKTFFEAQREDEIHRKIESIDIDKFKPLGKYLRGSLRTTADKNIELLGWLINFPSDHHR